MPVVETFFGYVETTKDSLLLLEACRQGVLPRVGRRLQEQERPLVKSGAVFCFDENESGIKRWTDGLVWSPSRILGNFLIYRELDDKKNIPDDDEQGSHSQQQQQTQQQQQQQIITSGLTLLSKRQRERSLVGSLRNSYRFKPNGLIKKSMSVVVNGIHHHLVSYYNKDDVVANKFQTPSDIPELARLEISSELLDGQNFRIPFFISNDTTSANNITSGDKRTSAIKPSPSERPTKQKKRSASSSSSYVQVLSNTSSSSRRYSSYSLTPSPQYNNSSSASSSSSNSSNNGNVTPLHQPSTPSSLISTCGSYTSDRQVQDDQLSSTTYHPHHHHLASYSQRQPQHLASPLTEPSSTGIFFPSSFVIDHPHHRQTSITENQSIIQHLPPQQRSGSLDMNEGCQPYMAVYKGTTKSAGMVSETHSSLNNNMYYQHNHHHQQQQQQQHLPEINSSTPPPPPTSYGVGSDAHHHHQQWAPHSFSTGYSNERYDQNPHQHLFSSTSFHAINHAALPTRTTELVSNAFMLDTNALLGSGWNDFEMQM